MKIGGFMKQSFVDFPTCISAVIFTNGCNLNCWYCHNHDLIDGKFKENYDLKNILKFLETRKHFIDGVVISGGEPTLQIDLLDAIKEIKSHNFKVKLDTNGTNPEILEKALKLVDYVAMDIKNSLDNYSKTVGYVDIEKIKKSVNLLKNWDGDYEFRTTLSPDIKLEDYEKIGFLIKGAKKYFIQKYVPQTETAPKQCYENYEKALNIIKKFVPNSFIR